MTRNQYNTTLWHRILKINLGGAIMDEYDTFRRNSAKRIFDIEYSTKSSPDNSKILNIPVIPEITIVI